MGYPGRQNIYDAAIRRMVQQSLEEQEREFRQLHQSDSDEALLTYLKSSAARLHHTPWPGEIVGGSYLQERFGSWKEALTGANLDPPRHPNQSQTFARIQQETEIQKERYRKRKAEKKVLANQRRMEQEARKKKTDPK